MQKQKLFLLTFYAYLFVILCGCDKKTNTINTLLGTTLSKENTDSFIENQMKLLNMPVYQ